MKKGYSFFSFAEDVDLRKCMQECSEAGYDGVELVINGEGELNINSTESEILAIKRISDDFGLEVISVGSSLLWSYNVVSEDAKMREQAKATLSKQLETASLLGADTILVIPGIVGSDFAPMPVVSYETAYERSQKMIGSLIPLAKSCGVCMAVENVWNKFLLSPLEMRRYIDELDSKYVGAYFDVGNIIYIGYPEDWIRILGNRIRKIHFCDFKRGGATLSNFVDLLEGEVDFRKVMRALKDIGYDDYVTLEMFPNYPVFPMHTIKSGKLAMDLILGL